MMKAKVPINDDAGLEKEADVMGARALQMKPFSLSDFKTGKSVQSKKIIQRAPFSYTEGEEPKIPVSKLINSYGENADIEFSESDIHPEIDIIPDTENPMKEGPSEELSSNQKIEDITTVIIALSTNIKEYKEKKAKEEAAEKAKKDEEARMAEAEAALESAKIAEKEARIAAVEATKIAAVAAEAARIAEETAAAAEAASLAASAAAEAARIANETKAARVAAGNTTQQATNLAAEQAEVARTKVDECIEGNSTIEINSQNADLPAEGLEVAGNQLNNTNLFIPGPPALSFIENLDKAFSTARDYFYKKLRPPNLTDLGRIVGAFGSSVGIVIPVIGPACATFKNSIEYYQKYIEANEIAGLLILKDGSDKSPFTIQEIELIDQYKTNLDRLLKDIKIDLILDITEAISSICPPVGYAVKGLHITLKTYRFATDYYSSYLNDRERKKTERIGDKDVDELKRDKIDKKSEIVGFKEAVADLYNLKRLENEVPKNADKIREAQDNLDKYLRKINDLRLVYAGSNSLITKENLETFLTVEKEVIKKIAKEVSEEKGFMKQLYAGLSPKPKKVQIILEMKYRRIFRFDDILLEDIYKLSPEEQDYLYDKTKEAIKVACNRKRISATDRLEKIEKFLLTKENDAVINSYMLELYKGKNVYKETDTDKEKFILSVKKYISQFKK